MADKAAPETITVFWRPGCGFCVRLFRVLDRNQVIFQGRNIWEDDEARQLVRRHNSGDETVPTVAIGSEMLTNPDPKDLVERIRSQHPALVGPPPPTGLLSRLRHG